MIILGIDPGIGRTGWGVIEKVRSSQFTVHSYGCFETEPNSPIEGRLALIYGYLSSLIKEYNPEAMAVEELFFNTNTKTALVVGQARGVVLLTGAQNGLSIATYTPLQVKIALTGYGRAEKKQVGQMVKMSLGLKEIPKPDDTADALAIALTHAFSHKMNKK